MFMERRVWAPARAFPRYLGQQVPPPAPPAEMAPPAAPPAEVRRNGNGNGFRMVPWNAEPVQTAAVAQAVALAYAATASYLYGKKGALIDRILLGIGALAFGGAGFLSYRMAATDYPGQSATTRVLGSVFGTIDALTAIGAGVGAVTPKIPRGSLTEAAVAALPV